MAELTKYAQRAKVKHFHEGGNSTKYFHRITNRKHRKQISFQLEKYEGRMVGEPILVVVYHRGL